MSHTPGPWEAQGYQIVPSSSMKKPGGFHNHERIATVRQQGNRTKANAHLIAAAPDLLQALKRSLAEAKMWSHGQTVSEITIGNFALAEAAIAKAEPDQPCVNCSDIIDPSMVDEANEVWDGYCPSCVEQEENLP